MRAAGTETNRAKEIGHLPARNQTASQNDITVDEKHPRISLVITASGDPLLEKTAKLQVTTLSENPLIEAQIGTRGILEVPINASTALESPNHKNVKVKAG